MAVRLFREDQDVGWPFGTNGIGFSKGSQVDDNDIVFWYVAHLHHHAAEGGNAWHGCGPTIVAKVPTPKPLPRNLGISVSKRKDQMGGEITVTGSGFTPGGQVMISYVNIPNRPNPVSGGTAHADGNGNFSHWERVRCTSSNRDDAFLDVEVDALDVSSGLIAQAFTSATIWVC